MIYFSNWIKVCTAWSGPLVQNSRPFPAFGLPQHWFSLKHSHTETLSDATATDDFWIHCNESWNCTKRVISPFYQNIFCYNMKTVTADSHAHSFSLIFVEVITKLNLFVIEIGNQCIQRKAWIHLNCFEPLSIQNISVFHSCLRTLYNSNCYYWSRIFGYLLFLYFF